MAFIHILWTCYKIDGKYFKLMNSVRLCGVDNTPSCAMRIQEVLTLEMEVSERVDMSNNGNNTKLFFSFMFLQDSVSL